jgi:hypothetical protein
MSNDEVARDVLNGGGAIADWEKAAVGELRPAEPVGGGGSGKRAPYCRECGTRHWGPAHPLPWGKIQERLSVNGETEEGRSVSDALLKARLADGSLVIAKAESGEVPGNTEEVGQSKNGSAEVAAAAQPDGPKVHPAKFDKAAYQREYMRRRRLAAKEAREKATWGEGLAGKP